MPAPPPSPVAAAPLPPLTLHAPRQTGPAWLHDTTASRLLEGQALSQQARPGELMAMAGLSLAKLALALRPACAPGRFWVLAGPGNNGGDGLVAARWLHSLGHSVQVVIADLDPSRQPADARQALAAAQAAGVPLRPDLPSNAPVAGDLIIDALLGLGQQRPPAGAIAAAVAWQRAQPGPLTLAADLPTGLCGDSGRALGGLPETAVQAHHTLALLTLKPGLFTHEGQDLAGRVWWDTLGVAEPSLARTATARLQRADTALPLWPSRQHAQHKGSFGDLWVIGGAPGMAGAAQLAARAALAGGAGRVYLAPLDPQAAPDPTSPELMQRQARDWQAAGVLEAATVVCGCGGGTAVQAVLPEVLARAGRLVLDADALNAIAADTRLMAALQARGSRSAATVLTPHPLEAARLAGCTVAEIQAGRLQAAQRLAQHCQAVVLLKGNGTVVAAPQAGTPGSPALRPWLNSSGNARLATPGSGDVLAGWLGAAWAAQPEATIQPGTPPCSPEAWPARLQQAQEIAAAAAWAHGAAAELDSPTAPRLPLRATQLIEAMVALLHQAA